jgi:HAD superfamily hydrolase (TIGR01509 family)
MQRWRLRALIFDLDGVLADTEPCHVRAWREVLPRYGIHLPEEWFRDWIGVADRELAAHLQARHGPPVAGPQLLAEKRAAHVELLGRCLQPFPGLREAILSLDTLPRAVATSSARAEALRVLEIVGMETLFPAVVTADDVERLKPAPDLYLAAADRLGVEPGSCLAIEDSPNGIRAARRAGCRVLAIGGSFRPERLRGAHRVFDSTVSALRWVRAALDGRGGKPGLGFSL